MICRCLIIDDEPPSIKILKDHIASIEQMEVVGVFSCAQHSFDTLEGEQVDLLFLDVGCLGLPVMEFMKIHKNTPKVIYMSSHKNKPIEAFQLEALDYLSKPISYDRFLQAVKKYTNGYYFDLSAEGALNKEFLYFRAQRKTVKVILKSILYIESFKDYIIIHREDHPELKVKQSISVTEAILPKHLFIRTHRSYILAIKKITAFTNYDIEIGKVSIPVGSSYAHVIDQLYEGRL
ncbi:LytR/AlgR family response regulator transcription factor [Mangrovimonas xylaniphaga]|uniref:LytR/AlgR family response regulator transcription factor n=1 Tax=Mangrovimonas xylaniphaga TaxID=1645915 RepID=UPI0009EB2A5B|nr:LytTR family DNA-binding domain-containing protein [Mangrovimonas xylaniphaga]